MSYGVFIIWGLGVLLALSKACLPADHRTLRCSWFRRKTTRSVRGNFCSALDSEAYRGLLLILRPVSRFQFCGLASQDDFSDFGEGVEEPDLLYQVLVDPESGAHSLRGDGKEVDLPMPAEGGKGQWQVFSTDAGGWVVTDGVLKEWVRHLLSLKRARSLSGP